VWARIVAGVLVGGLTAGGATAIEIKPQQVIDRYHRVLSLLASGDREQAMQALWDLETRAIDGSVGSSELERYWRLKLKVIREALLAGEIDQLIPVVMLHHDAYLMYREKHQPFLAGHTRSMAAELAELLAKRSSDPQVQEFSSWVLTSFAVYMQDSLSVSSSARLLEQALKFAPQNRVALLALAAAHEKFGEYEPATRHLARAVEMNGDDHEARLRLAICQRRLKQEEAPIRHLRRLLDPGPPDWVRTLAFEELARIYRDRGERTKAEEVLQRGMSEFPAGQQLRIQAAAYLEMDRRPKEAAAILDSIAPAEGPDNSPRYVYDRWPHEGVEAQRGQMRGMVESRLGLLAAGLRSSPTTGVGS
jgi:tetratricopeptide (TPR) repeat protein